MHCPVEPASDTSGRPDCLNGREKRRGEMGNGMLEANGKSDRPICPEGRNAAGTSLRGDGGWDNLDESCARLPCLPDREGERGESRRKGSDRQSLTGWVDFSLWNTRETLNPKPSANGSTGRDAWECNDRVPPSQAGELRASEPFTLTRQVAVVASS